MNVPFVDLGRQYNELKEQIDEAIAMVVRDHGFIGSLNNKHILEFEKSFGSFIGSKHTIACGNGTDALEILVKSLGIGPGDEVIVPALSWIATSEAVSNMGATPVFVDIEPDYFTIDPDRIEEKITSRTKAVIPVHLYGHPADMKRIMKIAHKHKLIVIEDCAQAHGATIEDKRVGTFGDAAAFSFYPGKNLGAYGDAGCMVTNNDDIAQKARMIAQHGQSGVKHKHFIEGRNSRMDGMQAAILSAKLPHLADWTESRIKHANSYSSHLKELPIDTPKVQIEYRHVFHLYVIRTTKRDELRNFLSEKDIATSIQYPAALPFLDAYAKHDLTKEDFPIVTKYQEQILSLPMFPELTDKEISYVTGCIGEFFLNCKE